MAGRNARSFHKAKPDVLILFPDDWAIYSPTLLRLVDILSESFVVCAHVLDTGRVDNTMLDPTRFRRVRLPKSAAKLLRKTGTYRPYRVSTLARSARHEVGVHTQVIAVDADGAMAARLLGQPFHFLSLEVGRHPLLRLLAKEYARSVVIQSPERLRYQFGEAIASRLPIFYVQNAPEVRHPPPVRAAGRERPRLVYLGHLMPMHGLAAMLNLARAWPQATLTLLGLRNTAGMELIGSRNRDLVESGRVIVRDDYVPEAELPSFLAGFDIGLCLYELGRWRRDFNYVSSPAGKMFNYFSAGLPVVASNLTGLKPVSVHQAGIQVNSHEPETLMKACSTILDDYAYYSRGAGQAAMHYDFRRAVAPLADFLHHCIKHS
jgi:glycosyltransferase involved in cell wall biosynthesis